MLGLNQDFPKKYLLFENKQEQSVVVNHMIAYDGFKSYGVRRKFVLFLISNNVIIFINIII